MTIRERIARALCDGCPNSDPGRHPNGCVACRIDADAAAEAVAAWLDERAAGHERDVLTIEIRDDAVLKAGRACECRAIAAELRGGGTNVKEDR